MTSFKLIEANRRNARKSTGPTTQEGKQRSRCNAVRHGFTAETVIGALEDAEDYSAFEATIVADYDAQSAVERELVLRLASLLWRLRRATTMETGLFDIQADNLADIRHRDPVHSPPHQLIYSLFKPHLLASADSEGTAARAMAGNPSTVVPTRCFLRLCNLPNYALDRLTGYEATLWRQVAQTLVALDCLNRRKPNERRRSVRFRSLQEKPKRDAEDVW